MINRTHLPSLCRVIVLATFLASSIAYTQKSQSKPTSVNQFLSKLPSELTLRENGPQKYRLTTNWHNRDLSGNATGKFLITGEYTRALGDGRVRWNNVQIAVFQDPTKPDSDTLSQKWMEGFSYKSPDDIAKVDFFKDFPTDETIHLLRTLVWDVVTFEAFAWTYFDKLKLNEVFKPSDFEGFTVQMADWGTLKMKGLRLKWTGISKMNGELCALIQYESFVNPVRSLGIQGRSLYWGSIWVSLEDKQIEYATLNEDVVTEITSASNSKKVMNIQREVKFEKMK